MRQKVCTFRNIFAILALVLLIGTFAPNFNSNAAGHGSGQWESNRSGKWYQYEDGYYPKNKWQKIDGGWYHFDKQGYVETGWIHIGKKWYYSNKNGKMLNGWRTINGKRYYFEKDGVMKTGWRKTTKGWYYFTDEGELVKNDWVHFNGKYYFMRKNGLLAKRGWLSHGGEWYFICKDGSAKTGWLKDNKKYYYFNDEGVMKRNSWLCTGGYWYYFNGKGEMATGVVTIDGITYDFGTTGGISDPMSFKAQGYSSATNYLILVNRTTHTVAIYTGSQGNWTTLKSFACTDGVATPNGQFTVGEHVYHFGEEKGYTCWYATQITGEILFHSVLYNVNSMTSIQDGSLGVTASHGCIRLDINNAKWIYENIPQGTKIVIYQ